MTFFQMRLSTEVPQLAESNLSGHQTAAYLKRNQLGYVFSAQRTQ